MLSMSIKIKDDRNYRNFGRLFVQPQICAVTVFPH